MPVIFEIGKLKLEEVKWLTYNPTVLTVTAMRIDLRSPSSQTNTFFPPLY